MFYGSGLDEVNIFSGPAPLASQIAPERLGKVVSPYAQKESKTRFNDSK